MSTAKTRIMYIENKAGSLNGPARIGRVTFSKSGRSLTYGGRTFQSLNGRGFKANYYDVETGEEYWISGPRKDGQDRLYPQSTQSIEIDDDVAAEYWTKIRGMAAPSSRPKAGQSTLAETTSMTRDPRDQRFYALRKKDLSQLSSSEIAELIGYCDKMIEYAVAKKGRRGWVDLRSRLKALSTE